MIFIIVMINIIFSQTDIERVLKKGVEYYVIGEYEKAIEMYQEAMKIYILSLQ